VCVCAHQHVLLASPLPHGSMHGACLPQQPVTTAASATCRSSNGLSPAGCLQHTEHYSNTLPAVAPSQRPTAEHPQHPLP
jgi:hypothetical protein